MQHVIEHHWVFSSISFDERTYSWWWSRIHLGSSWSPCTTYCSSYFIFFLCVCVWSFPQIFGTTYTMFSSQSIHNSWTASTSWAGLYSMKTLMEMLISSGQAQGRAQVCFKRNLQGLSPLAVTVENCFLCNTRTLSFPVVLFTIGNLFLHQQLKFQCSWPLNTSLLYFFSAGFTLLIHSRTFFRSSTIQKKYIPAGGRTFQMRAEEWKIFTVVRLTSLIVTLWRVVEP